ncbi:HEPN domain-containing protein [Oscillospiraceae bacterium OttesenSCG-928-F05]|nr:HEPN domain-containing protein [Oscillospiraceae bacterium OttesenSCG-928-F05]
MAARRSTGAGDSRRYYEWLDKAQADLQSARILQSGGGTWASVVFHCHQVMEKALKAYLLFRTGRHFDGHNITFLIRQAMRQDWVFHDYLDQTPMFNRYYIETRYPTDLPFELKKDEVTQIFRTAESLYQRVAEQVFHNLRKEGGTEVRLGEGRQRDLPPSPGGSGGETEKTR